MNRTFARTLDSIETIFRSVDAFITAEGISADDAFATQLAVEELFTNMVRHNAGGAERIWVSLERDSDRLVVELRDADVEPFDSGAIAPPDTESPVHERRIGGLGVHIVRNIFDELTYEYSDRTLHVTAVRYLGRKDVRDPAG